MTTVYAEGQYLDENGNTVVSQGTQLAGEDLSVDVQKVEERFSKTNIATATTTTIKSGSGFLHALNINTTAAGTITIYNNTAGSGDVIAILPASAVVGTRIFNVTFSVGLTIVTGAASDLTVSWR